MKKILVFIISTVLMIVLLTINCYNAYSLVEISNKKYVIFIDVNELTLSLVNNNTKKFEKVYPIAIGKKDTPSPIGTWQITSKTIRKEPQFGGYWLGLNAPWDTFGIHGTSRPESIGTMASNGCIRMSNEHIREVFFLVDYNTSVIISAGPSFRFSPYVRVIKPNDKGTDVYHVQRRLKDLGYFKGTVNGIYDYSLEIAVLKYRRDYNIPGDNKIEQNFLDSIGLWKFE